MTLAIRHGTRIGQARIRAPRTEAEACAARCASIVPSLDLEPAAMPPQAVLCVRSVQDPLPGGLDTTPRHVARRPAAWEAAMRASLREALLRAARPIDGPVPATADAVFFADPSEMLACAARDVCGGSLRLHWWWRHLLPASGFEAVVQNWCEAPTYVPAAFESLIATGAASGFVRRLSRVAAARLLDAALRAHGADSLADGIALLWVTPSLAAAQQTRPVNLAESPVVVTADPPPLLSRTAAPWRDIVPVAWEQGGLTPQQRVFAAICIVLRRAPTLPRRPGFVAAVIAHVRDDAAPSFLRASRIPDVPPVPGRHSRPAEPLSAPQVRVAHRTHHSGTDAQMSSAVTRTHALTAREDPSKPGTRRDVAIAQTGSPRGETIPPAAEHAATHERAASARERSRSVDVFRGDSRPIPRAAFADPVAPNVDAGIESAYAGAFFLLNVARDLDLYADGWSDARELGLGVWNFLELIARDVLTDEEFDEDPLGVVLRSLSDPAAPAPVVAPEERTELVTRFREHIDVAVPIEDATSFLIRRRGQIVRTAAHLDVHFSLDRHPIEIRMARLDRNPGWIPAAGVHVGFHFN